MRTFSGGQDAFRIATLSSEMRAEVRDIKPGVASEAGEALAGRVIEMMPATGKTAVTNPP